MPPDVAVLTDNNGRFWASLEPGAQGSMRVDDVRRHLADQDLNVTVLRVEDVDVRQDWRGTYVLYPSSEDPGLSYKAFIGDVLVALTTAGAVPLPGLPLFFAHHNKSLMELLRKVWLPDDPLADTRVFSTYGELQAALDTSLLPAYLKTPEGAGSAGVHRVTTESQTRRRARRLSVSVAWSYRLHDLLIAVRHPGWRPPDHHRRRLILQPEVPGLSGDFKVLKFGERYFAVRRQNRPGRQTASGSGHLDFDVERYVDVQSLLAYCAGIAERIPTPVLSLDIAESAGKFHLLEFQALYFGPATLQRSRRHWLKTPSGAFAESREPVTLEFCYAEALGAAIRGEPQS